MGLKDPKDLRRRFKEIDRKIKDLLEYRTSYARDMLKFGSATWIFGLASFVSILLISGGPNVLLNAPPGSVSLLMGSAAAPIFITAGGLLRKRIRIMELRRKRERVQSKYKKSVLFHIRNQISV